MGTSRGTPFGTTVKWHKRNRALRLIDSFDVRTSHYCWQRCVTKNRKKRQSGVWAKVMEKYPYSGDTKTPSNKCNPWTQFQKPAQSAQPFLHNPRENRITSEFLNVPWPSKVVLKSSQFSYSDTTKMTSIVSVLPTGTKIEKEAEKKQFWGLPTPSNIMRLWLCQPPYQVQIRPAVWQQCTDVTNQPNNNVAASIAMWAVCILRVQRAACSYKLQ